jgi:hypothetical protein
VSCTMKQVHYDIYDQHKSLNLKQNCQYVLYTIVLSLCVFLSHGHFTGATF